MKQVIKILSTYDAKMRNENKPKLCGYVQKINENDEYQPQTLTRINFLLCLLFSTWLTRLEKGPERRKRRILCKFDSFCASEYISLQTELTFS